MGPPAADGAGSRSSTRSCGSSSSTATRWPARPAWAGASTRSCRPASSPSAACCRATRPSPRSSTPSRRPTASAAKRWCRRTSRPWIATLEHLHEVAVPATVTQHRRHAAAGAGRGAGVRAEGDGQDDRRRGRHAAGQRAAGRRHLPTGTAQWEKRNIALEIPVWDEDLCIQCGKCVLVCPHAVIRAKVYDPSSWTRRPRRSSRRRPAGASSQALRYTLQVAPEDCTGCALCVEVCPAKNKSEVRRKAINMAPQPPLREQEAANWEFFLRPARGGSARAQH